MRAVRTGLGRFFAARRPMRAEQARRIAELPEEHAPLLDACLGWDPGDGRLHVPAIVRALLADGTAETHETLAAEYERLDGASDPSSLRPRGLESWLEKVHHLAHAGPRTESRWEAQTKRARELYWDRGRSLSIQFGLFREAADVYRECVRRFREDAYGWHYLGFNLDRAGVEPLEAEAAFREAAGLDPEHLWYRGRLVSFLIEQAQYREAEAAMREAQAVLDGDGTRLHADAELALGLHGWVVQSWLDAWEVARARTTFDEIPRHIINDHPELRAIEWAPPGRRRDRISRGFGSSPRRAPGAQVDEAGPCIRARAEGRALDPLVPPRGSSKLPRIACSWSPG